MKAVLQRLKPSQKEQQQFTRVSRDFLEKLNAKLKEAKAILGGSGAKGTWLAGNYDVDIFVVYNFKKYAAKSAELSHLLEPVLRKSFPGKKITCLHGSRDYFQLEYQSIQFEIVPILNIKKAEQALNITDISPLHAVWVNKHTKKVKDDILLAKQFCKVQGMYGAESHIQGFSGYALEILIAHYGSFEKLLRAARRWKVLEVIDISQHYPPGKALTELNQSKLQSPLVVIDPIDKRRNASAALSLEKFLAFKKAAQEYLQKPGEQWFEKKEISFSYLQTLQGKHNLVFISVDPLAGKKDVVGTKLLKTYLYLQKKLNPFLPLKSGWEWNGRAIFYFILEKKELAPEEIRSGPPMNLKHFVDDFKKKNQATFVKEGRIYARIPVAHPKLKDFIQRALRDAYVKERIRRVHDIKVI